MVNTVALKDASVMHQPNEQEPEGQQGQQQGDSRPDVIICPVRMTSVVRVSKLPVIEGTLKIATDMYKKAKVSHLTVNFDEAFVVLKRWHNAYMVVFLLMA
jgi:hypothetical protein